MRSKNKKLFSLILISLLFIFIGFMRVFFVESAHFPDRSTTPKYSIDNLKLVANLDYPPANLAVTDDGDVYFTFHPEGKPPYNLAKLVNGKATSWPSKKAYQEAHLDLIQNAYSIRIDSKNHLWILDNKPTRLVEYDLNENKFLTRYYFSKTEFGFMSHANDFNISRDSKFIYISDDGLFNKKPGIIVYDIEKNVAWKRLESHTTTKAAPYVPVVQDREMTAYGLFSINPGVDGITLSRDDQWLYYAPFSGDKLYRIPRDKISNQTLADSDLEPFIESVSSKTMTDGMTTDASGNIYLSDIEHSAIIRMSPQGKMKTLLKDKKLRWPDGFSFGEDDWLYVSCSSLHQVIGVLGQKQHAPFQIYKFKTGINTIAGQ